MRIGMAENVTNRRNGNTFAFATATKAGTKSRCGCSASGHPGNRGAHFQRFMAKKLPRYGSGDFDVEARIRDMDEEGVDVNMMVPGGVPSTDDADLEMAFIRAQHRYLNDFTSKYPNRLGSLIIASGLRVEDSVREIKKWSRSAWRWA